MQDDKGKKWHQVSISSVDVNSDIPLKGFIQIRKYWSGVGSVSWLPSKFMSAALGTGVDQLIGEVYKVRRDCRKIYEISSRLQPLQVLRSELLSFAR